MATTSSGAAQKKSSRSSLPKSIASQNAGQPNLEELLAHAPAAIAVLSGPELRCSYVNDMAVRVTGRLSADQLLGKTFREGIPEFEGTGVYEIVEEVARSLRPFVGREYKVPLLQFETGTLTDRYFDFVCQPMLDENGGLQGIFIHAVDLTDRVLIRRALEATQEHLRLAHEAAQVGTWEWDGAANTRVLSPELHEMFGTDPKASDREIEETWASRLHPADKADVFAAMSGASRSGSLEVEYRYQHPLRGERFFYTKGRVVDGGTRLMGVVLDVTDQKNASKLAAEQRERFEFATGAGDIGYWFCDLPFDKLIWDERVKEHFWLAPDADVDIELFYRCIHPDDREMTKRAIEESIANHTNYDVEYRTISLEGKQKWIRATGRTAYDESGRPIRFDGVTQEVTALKQTREALIRSEKLALVGRLATSISHEINNPLEAVINLLYLINQNSTDEMVRAFSESAQQELARVSHIVTHTLRFNRQPHGAEREKLSNLLDSSAAIYTPRMKSLGVEIVRDYGDSQPVLCFGSEIRQVFANLIGNSFDALKPGGRLMLKTRDQANPRTGEPGVLVSIADSGSGMNEETKKRLFEPFFTTKGEKGTGLGLWVSREILRKHRAVLRVRSRQTAGKSGTAFSIWLPMGTPASEGK
ncbi:PAS domain-containing sensor histidine kinase [Occallatibacter savannae]|uniref:PAS domain-containing sensor histidine kinase n=1 Tax=Occallatibacter savannae TaxID=1002691 RepID=UPI000D693455|nr:PAS domain-containing sensor histidine kinase [Occallatibacter savannae]